MNNYRYPSQKNILAGTKVTFRIKCAGDVKLILIEEYSKRKMEIEMDKTFLNFNTTSLHFNESGEYTYYFEITIENELAGMTFETNKYELNVFKENYLFGGEFAVNI